MNQTAVPAKSNHLPLSCTSFSTYRGVLMGVATLMVVLYHSAGMNLDLSPFLSVKPVTEAVNYLFLSFKWVGNAGVDLFLLLSGIGLYRSFSGNPSVKAFWRRRAVRILPPLLIVALIWYAIGEGRLYFSHVLLVSFFGGDQTHWYFLLIICLYAIYPLIHKAVARWGLVFALIVYASFAVISAGLFLVLPGPFGIVEICFTRVPVFVLGVWLGRCVAEQRTLPGWTVPVSSISVVVLFIALFCLRYFGIYTKCVIVSRFLYAPFVLTLCVVLTVLFSRHPAREHRFLTWVGGLSMEVYLLYEKLGNLCNGFFVVKESFGISYWLPVFVLTLLTAMALQSATKKVSAALFDEKKGS